MNALTAVMHSAKERRSRLYRLGAGCLDEYGRFAGRQSQSRNCYEIIIIIKTFLIVFHQIYTITYRIFKICPFNAFVKLTKAVTFLFGTCQILSLMTN